MISSSQLNPARIISSAINDVIYLITEASKYIKYGISGDNDIPAILLGIVAAYLTILITVAIAIFSDQKDFEALDRNVILDHVVKAKRLLIYLGLAFFPLLFWNGSRWWLRIVIVAIWANGVFFITNILINSYHWMKGNKHQLRLDYLKQLHNDQDVRDSWSSIWAATNITPQDENEYFEIFKLTIDKLLTNAADELSIPSRLLSNFDTCIENRSTFFLTRPKGILSIILEWHFVLWKKEHEYLHQDDKLDIWSSYRFLSQTMDSTIRKIEARAFNMSAAYPFIKIFEKHAHKYENETVSNHMYTEHLLNTFYHNFFINIQNSPERHDIWEHYFPTKWKVTVNNLKDPNNRISSISLSQFINWASDRIASPSDDIDITLHNASTNLFPDVDPISWAMILIFMFSPYGENRLGSIVKGPWTFGFMGRVRTYSKYDKNMAEELREKEIDKTFELSDFYFEGYFSEAKLEEYIQSLELLSYPPESREEHKRLRLHALFNKMLDFKKQ